MSLSDDGDVQVEVFIRAAPEAVFPYFTDPGLLMRWMGVAAELDPRPGGLFRVDVTGRDVARGTYREIDPPRRVAFTWGWEGADSSVPPGASLVVVELEPQPGGTLVRLTHSGLARAAAERHAEGWRHFAQRLEVAAAGGDPGPDPWAAVAPGT